MIILSVVIYTENNKPETVSVAAETSAADIFGFQMYNTFASTLGAARLLFSAFLILLAVLIQDRVSVWVLIVLIAAALLNPVATPLKYLAQARITAANSHKSIYTFAPDAIHINTDGKRMSVEWGTLLLAVWTRRALYLYVSPTKAFLLPRCQMQGHDEEILSYLKTFCPEKNRKISRGA